MITKSLPTDLEAINTLLKTYGLVEIDANWLNEKDLALVAKDGEKVVGFVWCGLCNNQTLAYLDYLTVDAEYAKSGVGHKLCEAVRKELLKLKTKDIIMIIARDRYYFKSRNLATSFGMKPHKDTFTFLYGSVSDTEKR